MDFFKPHFWRAIITFPLWKIWVLFLFGASYLLLSIHVTYILNSMLLFSLNLRSRAEYHDTLKQKCKMWALWIYPNIFQPRQVRENIILPYRSPSDHLHDRVTCTYEVPQSSELQSIDPVLVQQMQSSAELTVHLTLSQTEFGPAICETLSDCEKECEYDDVDETNRKSRSVSEGYSDIQERTPENTMLVSGDKGIQ